MAAEHFVTIYGTVVMVCAPDGIPLDTEGTATELVGEALGQRAGAVVMPVERLTDDFFDLSTGVAGDIAQKFVNYQLRLAVIGDITARTAASESLAAWVTETNAGKDLWFLRTFDELQVRLDRRGQPSPQ